MRPSLPCARRPQCHAALHPSHLAASLQHLLAAGGGHASAEAAHAGALPARSNERTSKHYGCELQCTALPWSGHGTGNRLAKSLLWLVIWLFAGCHQQPVSAAAQHAANKSPPSTPTHRRVPRRVTPRPFLLLHSTSRPLRPAASASLEAAAITSSADQGTGRPRRMSGERAPRARPLLCTLHTAARVVAAASRTRAHVRRRRTGP